MRTEAEWQGIHPRLGLTVGHAVHLHPWGLLPHTHSPDKQLLVFSPCWGRPQDDPNPVFEEFPVYPSKPCVRQPQAAAGEFHEYSECCMMCKKTESVGEVGQAWGKGGGPGERGRLPEHLLSRSKWLWLGVWRVWVVPRSLDRGVESGACVVDVVLGIGRVERGEEARRGRQS